MSYPVYSVPAGDVLPIFFDTFDGGTGASVTMSGLAVTDIEVYKDGSVTQRSSDAGYTLLDTDGIDFDGVTGIHGFSIDTGDNTDSGFYTVGSWFHVVVSAITVDAQTVNFVAAAFRIMAAEDAAGVPDVNVTHWLGAAASALNTAEDLGLLVETTIATLASQTSFTLTAGSSDDDAYNNRIIVIQDASTAEQKAVGTVSDYTGSTKTVTLAADPGIFTMATTDIVRIFAIPAASAGSGATAQEVWEYSTRTLTALDEDSTTLDIDAAVRAAVGLAAANLDTQLSTIDGNVDSILVDTAEIGAAGAGLTALASQASVDTIDNLLDTEVAAILEDTGTTLPATLSTIAGYLDTEIAAIKAVTDLLPDAGALTSIATAASLATVDTAVDAIKAKTDSLTFTNTGVVDANITHVISDAVVASSAKETNWGGTA